ncbi:MAG TPA: glycosyltransferase family 2 protein [Acidimicrobiales bacterium]|nr:glycosyltransferase family 2 protein [Acidimicrobiales bacterium]
MTGPADLSVVVVTWNSSQVIGACLRSVLETTAGQRVDVIVVDNHSGDDTVARVEAAAPGARIIVNGSNRGLAAANNQGLRAARAADIVICNPDVEFRPGALDEMRAVLHRHPRAGWVVPRLVLPDGSPQASAGDLPTLAAALMGRQAARARRRPGPSGFWWDGWAHDEERRIGRGSEAAYLVRRQALEDVGPQDDRYVLDWEGLDWSDRFHRAGWETWLAPGAEVLHRGGHSLRQVPYRAVVSHHRGMYLYFADRRPAVWRPVLAAAFALRAAVKLAATAAGRPYHPWDPGVAGGSRGSSGPTGGPGR